MASRARRKPFTLRVRHFRDAATNRYVARNPHSVLPRSEDDRRAFARRRLQRGRIARSIASVEVLLRP